MNFCEPMIGLSDTISKHFYVFQLILFVESFHFICNFLLISESSLDVSCTFSIVFFIIIVLQIRYFCHVSYLIICILLSLNVKMIEFVYVIQTHFVYVDKCTVVFEGINLVFRVFSLFVSFEAYKEMKASFYGVENRR